VVEADVAAAAAAAAAKCGANSSKSGLVKILGDGLGVQKLAALLDRALL
jgi:hypothetical protein